MKKTIKALAMCLVVCMVLGVVTTAAFALETIEFNFADDDYYHVVSSNNYPIAPGAKEQSVVFNNDEGSKQALGHVMRVDMSNPDIRVMTAYKDMDPNHYGTATLMEMAQAAEQKMGVNVVGGINVMLSWNTCAPMGMLVCNGEVWGNDLSFNRPYLVVNNDRSVEIREGNVPLTGNEYQAISGANWLIKDGVNIRAGSDDHGTLASSPCTAIGITAEEDIILFEVDGRQDPISCGMSMGELSETMLALGCVQSFECDGGGSSTFISEREGSGELSVKNVPSDGKERASIQCLLVVSDATPSGIFDHASVSADNLNPYYTPGSSIQFNAIGVDSAGGAAILPESGLSWTLTDNSLGSIDENGLFTSNGTVGEVTAQLIYQDNIVGSASVSIMEPDSLEFLETSRSIDFEQDVELAMLMQSGNFTLNYKPEDFTWRMELVTANDPAVTDPTEIGNMVEGTTTFRSNPDKTGTVNVTAVYTKADNTEVTAVCKIVVGQEPFVFWDYEDGYRDVEIWEEYNVTDPETGEETGETSWRIKRDEEGNIVYENKYFDAEDYFSSLMVANPNSPTLEEQMASHFGLRGDRGAAGSTEIVDIDSGEPVRFGDKSLKMNYDFTNSTGAPSVLGYGYMQNTNYAPGSPTGLGMWIYVPEGTPAYSIKSIIQSAHKAIYLTYTHTYVDENGETQTLSNTADMAGKGWIYITASLVGKGDGTFLMLRNYTIRLIAEGFEAHPERKAAGSVYIDNIEFIYGTNNKDTVNPTVSDIYDYDTNASIAADGSMAFDKNLISFASKFHDDDGKYAAGMDLNSVRIYIDGVNMSGGDDFVVTPDNVMVLGNVSLSNGRHSIAVRIRDNYGNETIDTRYFTVQGSGVSDTNVAFVPAEGYDKAYIGETFDWVLTTDNAANLTGVNADITLTRGFGTPTVTFADGFTGNSSYNAGSGVLTINAVKNEGAEITGNVIAAVELNIPDTLNRNNTLAYSVSRGSFTTAVESGFTNTFCTEPLYVTVAARYVLDIEPVIVGHEFTITVSDEQNNPVENAAVYINNAVLEQQTNAEGKVTYTVNEQGFITVYAQNNENNYISWHEKVMVHGIIGDADGKPFYIQNNAAMNNDTVQSITWLSNIDAAADNAAVRVYQVNPAEQENAEFTEYTGTTENIYLSDSAVRANTVRITNLTPGTVYYYAVGDGNIWSDKYYSFSTVNKDNNTNFFIIGDTQTTDTSKLDTLLARIREDGKFYDFMLQTGDAVDDPTKFAYWNALSSSFNAEQMNGVDMIHVEGNHELYGNEDGSIAQAVWDLPESGSATYYSFEYDNVYVAVINYAMDGDYSEALEWLKHDAKQTNCLWKVLSMHVPAYGTNAAAANTVLHETLPPIVDEIGIDFVFAGHDHAYARTEPMIGGEVDARGTTYYICGSTGEKSYEITDNPEYHFAYLEGEYDAMYMTVSANDTTFQVDCYNLAGERFDTYIMDLSVICNGEHEYVYNKETNTVYCPYCHQTVQNYSGWAEGDQGEGKYYLVAGNYVDGFMTIDNTATYFVDGIAVNGEYVIAGKTCTFVDGVYSSCTDPDILFAGWCGGTDFRDIGFLLHTDGLFELIGSGNMINYQVNGSVPWVSYKENTIKRIFIGKDIISIGNYAFGWTYNVTDVTFEAGSKLERIGADGLHYLQVLERIELPETVTRLEYYAIGYAKHLMYIYMPTGMDYIAPTAFNNHNPNLVMNVAEDSYAYHYALEHNIQVEVRPSAITASGDCGTDLTWTLYDNGEMVISGSGAMTDYASKSAVPWDAYRNDIKKIVIGKDVTSVGNYAFGWCYNVTDVTFEEGSVLEKIGWAGFHYQMPLKTVVLPETVTYLGGYAFGYTKHLTSIYMPANIDYIAPTAFDISNPNLVMQVAEDSYAHHYALEHNIQVEVRPSATTASGDCGTDLTWTLYDNGKIVISGSGAMTDYASKSAVPWDAYRNDIKKIVIGKDVTSVGNYAFGWCYNVTDVTFEEGSVLERIGWAGFHYQMPLKTVVLPETVTYLGGYAFGYTKHLTSIYMPANINYIAPTAFDISNPNLSMQVAEDSYAYHYALEHNIQVEVRPSATTASGDCGTDLTWTLYDNGKIVISGSGAMTDYASKSAVPWDAYRNDIKKIVIGKDVTSVGNYAFGWCYNVTDVMFEEGSVLERIGWAGFHYQMYLKNVVLPETVTYLGGYAFGYTYRMTSINLPESIAFIADTAFDRHCESLVVTVTEGSYAHQYAVAHEIAVDIK